MKPTYLTIKNTKKNLEFTFTITHKHQCHSLWHTKDIFKALIMSRKSWMHRTQDSFGFTVLTADFSGALWCKALFLDIIQTSLLCNMWILALYICSPRFVKAFMDGPSVIPQPHGHFAFHLNSFSLDLESWLNWTEDEIPQQINFLALMLVHSQENCPHSDQGDQRGREETVKIQTSFVSS